MHASEKRPSARGREPLYLRIARGLRSQILSGEYENGEALPPVRLLAAEQGVHFNTIARAYRLLEREGLVAMRPGRGTRVETHPREHGESPEYVLRSMISDALNLGLTLGLTRDEGIAILERLVAELSSPGDEDPTGRNRRSHTAE